MLTYTFSCNEKKIQNPRTRCLKTYVIFFNIVTSITNKDTFPEYRILSFVLYPRVRLGHPRVRVHARFSPLTSATQTIIHNYNLSVVRPIGTKLSRYIFALRPRGARPAVRTFQPRPAPSPVVRIALPSLPLLAFLKRFYGIASPAIDEATRLANCTSDIQVRGRRDEIVAYMPRRSSSNFAACGDENI